MRYGQPMSLDFCAEMRYDQQRIRAIFAGLQRFQTLVAACDGSSYHDNIFVGISQESKPAEAFDHVQKTLEDTSSEIPMQESRQPLISTLRG
jgi:hypothetical protein